MLKLKSLKISNVGRFVGDHSISFDNRPYLIQIDAKNLNTGGSSGSGKSTIFNSLEYLLGTNQIPSTILQSRLTKSAMSVSGEFDYDGKNLVITRTKSGGLSIFINDVEIVGGNNKAAEEKLDEILGIPRELLRKMVHKRQKEGGFFLGLTPKECHSFLAEALDLKSWTARLLASEADVKKFEQEEQSGMLALQVANNSLQSALSSLLGLEEPKTDIAPESIVVLKNNLDRAEFDLKEESLALQSALAAIVMPARPSPLDKGRLAPLQSKIAELRAQEAFERKTAMDKTYSSTQELQALEQKLSKIKNIIDNSKNYKLQLEEIKTKIIAAKQGTCPTCKQGWHQGHEQMDALISQARQKTLDIQNAESMILEIPFLEESISKQKEIVVFLRSQANISSLAQDILSVESEFSIESAKLDKEANLLNQAYQLSVEKTRSLESSVRQSYQDKLAALSYSVDELKKLYFSKKTELESFQKAVEMYNRNKKSLSSAVDLQKKEVDTLIEKNTKASQMKLISSEASKVIRGYMNSLFQDTLDSIALKSTQILSRIPNMSTSTIYFEGFKETKSGTIKDEVTAILTMDGEIDIPVKSMSGGERTAIDLAVDLAVIDMIEERAGKGLDIFVLDEPFDGLDSACREQCLEILRSHSSGKRIVVVDHSNETKEMVQDRIVVIRDGQDSKIDDRMSV